MKELLSQDKERTRDQRESLNCDPIIPLLGVHHTCMCAYYVHQDTCTRKVMGKQFMVAENRKQLYCPSTEEWTDKLWSSYIMKEGTAIEMV